MELRSSCSTARRSATPSTPQVIEELTDAFETLSKNPECRLVFIRGAGPVFSAGADLEWMRAAANYTEQRERGRRLWHG